MTKFYSVKYPTRRWPVQIWSNVLNMSGINAWILFNAIHNRKVSRYTFLCNVVNDIRDLVKPKDNQVINTPKRTRKNPTSSSLSYSSSSSPSDLPNRPAQRR